MAKFWTGSSGYSVAGLGHVKFEGAEFALEPGVPPERMIAEMIDAWLLPSLRQLMIDALDGTRDREREAFEAKLAANELTVIQRRDPTWCPDTPTAQELYSPNGYVRRPDGEVVKR